MARLVARTIQPDLVVSSPAARALATAELVAQEIKSTRRDVLVEPVLYEACVDDYFELVTTLPESATSVLIVGHNPTITEFVNALVPGSVGEIPVAGAAGVTAEIGSWKDIRKNCGTLLFFEHPGGLRV